MLFDIRIDSIEKFVNDNFTFIAEIWSVKSYTLYSLLYEQNLSNLNFLVLSGEYFSRDVCVERISSFSEFQF